MLALPQLPVYEVQQEAEEVEVVAGAGNGPSLQSLQSESESEWYEPSVQREQPLRRRRRRRHMEHRVHVQREVREKEIDTACRGGPGCGQEYVLGLVGWPRQR